MEDLIVLNNLRKVYRMGDEKIIALDNVSLSIRKEEFICLLGTSGSGKSTLLNMMAGLEKPTKGEITIGKYPIHKMNERDVTKFRQKYVGFVFQSYNLIPTLSALENVSLGLTFQGIPKAKREKMAKQMLIDVGLEKRLHHKPSEMSGGQQQRVSIARAFVGKPQIVFADEPTGNLDTRTTLEIMNLITGMAYEFKQTLIIVTHDVEIADYAHRVVYLRDGHIEKITENENIIKGAVN
ncbi:ABC transporter ATP-binding protein [Tissierella carlieri]|uniref:ABC transporter ATP-binding protein n=1 Tax=Tissierella carlieri TaxID=689904 RepID=A0ABT1S9K1_9FIRM|nr:ABC transporter ATP-binding protein [Tissierella carlieri]MCQ4923146.1 ABC transporter ATP-binding protein [Tissierella carlieri]MDU5082068.1 ABC transporter ATP-binding protein [Bacillota bacterium]